LKPSTFHIFNASAGSGKTFTLVKEYLKVLFGSKSKFPFKHILAITFTNKAVGEMKERIIKSLIDFSNDSILMQPTEMFKCLCEELQLEPVDLHKRSKSVLQDIVHNYAAFDVSTIDKFNQKLIRNFAFDLKIPMNFEVELDTDLVLSQAVDRLIAKAGSEPKLTKVLVDFAFEKIDEDKSWDVAYDLNIIAKMLISENDIEMVKSLNNRSLEDFKNLKAGLSIKNNSAKQEIERLSNSALQLIEEHGLQFSDFNRGSLPKHFLKLSQGDYKIDFTTKWQLELEDGPLYPKRLPDDLARILDDLQPDLIEIFKSTKSLVFAFKFHNAIYKNIIPLSVLNAIQSELNVLKDEKDLLLISEFNTIVSEHIKTQPAPFIYERIGEKFKHFFIDEFQDTSILQWLNLIPLINNALSGVSASNLLVGDAKQAIYRWRGGKAEQFIDLYEESTNPFHIKAQIKKLETNHRSSKQVIDFNNAFFSFLSQTVFSNPSHANIYKNSWQEHKIEEEGYVSLKFLDSSPNDQKDELYPAEVLKTINECLKNGFEQKDICILVRYKKDGIAIADHLNDHSTINIISSETLLLSRCQEINFIIEVLQLLSEPNNKELKFNIVSYLLEHKLTLKDEHQFYKEIIDLDLEYFFKSFEDHNIYFYTKEILQLPLYEMAEVIIHSFNLVDGSNGYIQYFLDFILDYSMHQRTSLIGFLKHYQDKKEKLSVSMPDGINAVKIMTIHKAKGLEFPVVIVPYADLNIYSERNPKIWFPLNGEEYHGFNYLLMNYNRDVEAFGAAGKELFEEHQAELELDNVNLYYVALTRAIEQLHVITEKHLDKKGNSRSITFGRLFIKYLKSINLWDEQRSEYTFGTIQKQIEYPTSTVRSDFQKKFISTSIKDLNINFVTHSGYLWQTDRLKAMEKGNLIHLIMSLIRTREDLGHAFDKLLASGILNNEQSVQLKPLIKSIVEHEVLSPCFASDITVYNERDIIVNSKLTVRPDRVIIDAENNAIIIDYKTGIPDVKHREQILGYKSAVEVLGIHVKKLILVYVNDTIETIEV
jgi:ATP-dependent exoDNAse (exonuclease V) beta subunit